MRSKKEEAPKPMKPAAALKALGARFEKFGKARDVLEPIVALPTRFVQYDWATRCGGHPLKRTCVVHGPSNGGKSSFVLGLLGSFVDGGHLADYVDAERTTPIEWLRTLVGAAADSDRFIARYPSTYEDCVDRTREIHRAVKAAVDAGELSPGTSLLTVVDSIRKLVPEDFFKKIAKFGAGGEKGSVDGMGGRGAMIKANMNAGWLDELTPLTSDCGTSWLGILRESEKIGATDYEKKIGEAHHIQGGLGMIFDAALRLRIELESYVTIPDGDRKKIVGERNRITIKKTKVGGKDDRATIAYFHTSNGVIAPEGFDRSRDVVDLGLKLGVLEMAGNRVRWPSRAEKTSFVGREAAIATLRFAEDDLQMLEQEVRASFSKVAPELASEVEERHETVTFAAAVTRAAGE